MVGFTTWSTTQTFRRVGALVTKEEAEAYLSDIIGESGSRLVNYDMFRVYCDGLDKVRELAQTPVTGVVDKKGESRRKQSLMPGASKKSSVTINVEHADGAQKSAENVIYEMYEEEYEDDAANWKRNYQASQQSSNQGSSKMRSGNLLLGTLMNR